MSCNLSIPTRPRETSVCFCLSFFWQAPRRNWGKHVLPRFWRFSDKHPILHATQEPKRASLWPDKQAPQEKQGITMFSQGFNLTSKVVHWMRSGDCVPRTKDRSQQTMLLPTFWRFPGERKIPRRVVFLASAKSLFLQRFCRISGSVVFLAICCW